jgi:hypothetical protein
MRTPFLYHVSQAMVPLNRDTLIPLKSTAMKPAPAALFYLRLNPNTLVEIIALNKNPKSFNKLRQV